jgi:diguanylate cyclase (GGDEF)-like protein
MAFRLGSPDLTPPWRDPSELAFAEAIAALSQVRTRRLELPPAIRARYLADTWTSRKKITQAWLVAVALVNGLCLLFDPFIVTGETLDVFVACRVAISVIFLTSAALLNFRAQTGLEGVAVIVSCVSLLALAGLGGAQAGPVLMERCVVQAVFVCGTGVIVTRIAWRDTVILTVATLAVLAVFLWSIPVGLHTVAEKAQMITFFAAGVAGLALSRQVQNRLHYRVYVLTMSERFKLREIEEMNSRLFAMARTDPLTTISNRRHFDEVFGALQIGANGRSAVALFMIDIDYFKGLNDEFGHAVGDERLTSVAGLIRAALRDGQDFVARFGGEEFVALLPDAGEREAAAIAERVRADVEASGLPNPGGIGGVITVSVGVAVAPPGNLGRLVADADAALYEAKGLGRNRVRFAAVPRSVQSA